MNRRKLLPASLFLFVILGLLYADETFLPSSDLKYAQVVQAEAEQNPGGFWTFRVTLRHNDQGWDHYADLWVVVDPETGKVLADRVLAHPHDTEQPFTRSLSGVSIPEEIRRVEIRGKCNLHGFFGKRILLDLSR